jgi:uncharacterized protein YjbI with pentapeptide repeats
MFETIRLVHMLRSQRTVSCSWASQVLAEQLHRTSAAQVTGQISVADANRYVVTLIRELEQLQTIRSKLFGRNAQLVFRDVSFDGLVLNNVKLREAYFSRCTFKGASLIKSAFGSSTFSDCSFDQADIRGSHFFRCSVNACLFRGALADGVRFQRSVLVRCDFENASLSMTRGVPKPET